MIKMTAALCLAIYLVMVIFGVEDPNQASAPDAVALLENDAAPSVETVNTPASQAADAPRPTIVAAYDPDTPAMAHAAVAVMTLDGRAVAEPAIAKAAPVKPIAIAAPSASQTAAPLPVYRIIGGRVNLRAGASTDFDIVGRVLRDERAELLEDLPNGWARIKMMQSGQVAFISGDFIAPAES